MSGFSLKKLGPGLLFAGAAIGVSHLVQSTRAGADFGFGLLWALLLINLIKYPFFQFGPRYAAVTGKSLLNGYLKLGKPLLVAYFVLTILTMFTIQTAVTIVTAGLAVHIFGITDSAAVWSVLITIVCALVLVIGRYKLLDKVMKAVIITLTLSTVIAVFFAFRESITNTTLQLPSFGQMIPEGTAGIAFLIAFMGWMPAPLDISIWHSLWTLEKKNTGDTSKKTALFDFNIGYFGTVILGVGFLSLGALVMFGTGETFSNKGGVFAQQLITMYTNTLGDWAAIFVGIAALTTMFSTTLTTLDASPRAMAKTSELLGISGVARRYLFWLVILVLGTSCILLFFVSEMGLLVKVATILSFLTAPFYAICNYLVFKDKSIPEHDRLSKPLQVVSIVSILALLGFSVWYISTLF